jgi:PTHB1 C-terminus
VKEKTTKDTEGIAELLEKCNLDLIATKRQSVKAERQLAVSQVQLTCALNLCRLVVQHLPVAPRIRETIAIAFVIPVNDWPDQSWAQALEPTIDQLTYSGPLRKHRQSSVYDGDFTYQPRKFDAQQFKRHFDAILEQTMQLAPDKQKQQQQQQQRQSSSEGADDDGLTAQTDDDGESDKNANNNASQSGEAERKQLSEWVNYEIPPTSRLINAANNSSGSRNNNNDTLS